MSTQRKKSPSPSPPKGRKNSPPPPAASSTNKTSSTSPSRISPTRGGGGGSSSNKKKSRFEDDVRYATAMATSSWRTHSTVPTYYVAPRGRRGYFAAINDAIAYAEPYSRIEVLSGTYFENVIISKPIEIVAAVHAEDMPVFNSRGITFLVQSECYIEGLKIGTSDHSAGGGGCGMRIAINGDPPKTFEGDDAVPKITHCEIDSIDVDADSQPHITENKITNSKGRSGMQLLRNSGGIYKANTFEHHEGIGLYCNSTGNCEFTHNKFSKSSGGQVVVTGNKGEKDAKTGHALKSVSPKFRYNRFTDDVPLRGLGSEMRNRHKALPVRKAQEFICLIPAHEKNRDVDTEEWDRAEQDEVLDRRAAVVVYNDAQPEFDTNMFMQSVSNGVLVASGGKGEFRNNRFAQNKTFAATIEGKDSSPLFLDNTIQDNLLGGIRVRDDASPRIEGNNFLENKGPQLIVKGDPDEKKGATCRDLFVLFNVFMSSTRIGIVIKKGAGRFIGNVFRDTHIGVRVEMYSEPIFSSTLENGQKLRPQDRKTSQTDRDDVNRFEQCYIGILATRYAYGSYKEVDFTNCRYCGVGVVDEARPRFVNCKFFANERAVIAFRFGRGIFSACQFREHHSAMITVKQRANPEFYECQFLHGQEDAVVIAEKGRGKFVNNFFSQNKFCHFVIKSGADPEVQKNLLVSSGRAAFMVCEGGNGTIVNNMICANYGDGFFIESHGQPTIRNNVIRGNVGAGVHVGSHGDGIIEKNEFLENRGSNVVITGGGSALVEKRSSHQHEGDDFSSGGGGDETATTTNKSQQHQQQKQNNNTNKTSSTSLASTANSNSHHDTSSTENLRLEFIPGDENDDPLLAQLNQNKNTKTGDNTSSSISQFRAPPGFVILRRNWFLRSAQGSISCTSFGKCFLTENVFDQDLTNLGKAAVSVSSGGLILAVANHFKNGSGIFVGDDGHCCAFINQFRNIKQGAAIVLGTGSRPYIAWNTIEDCSIGIACSGGGGGVCLENIINRCTHDAVVCSNFSRTTLVGNVILHGAHGIVVQDKAKNAVRANFFYGMNSALTVLGEHLQHFTFSNNLVLHCLEAAVTVRGGSANISKNLFVSNPIGVLVDGDVRRAGIDAVSAGSNALYTTLYNSGTCAHYGSPTISECAVVLGTAFLVRGQGKAHFNKCIATKCVKGFAVEEQNSMLYSKNSLVYGCFVGCVGTHEGSAEIDRCVLTRNIRNVIVTSRASPTLTGCLISNADFFNVIFDDEAKGLLKHCVIKQAVRGGGIYVVNGSTPTIDTCLIRAHTLTGSVAHVATSSMLQLHGGITEQRAVKRSFVGRLTLMNRMSSRRHDLFSASLQEQKKELSASFSPSSSQQGGGGGGGGTSTNFRGAKVNFGGAGYQNVHVRRRSIAALTGAGGGGVHSNLTTSALGGDVLFSQGEFDVESTAYTGDVVESRGRSPPQSGLISPDDDVDYNEYHHHEEQHDDDGHFHAFTEHQQHQQQNKKSTVPGVPQLLSRSVSGLNAREALEEMKKVGSFLNDSLPDSGEDEDEDEDLATNELSYEANAPVDDILTYETPKEDPLEIEDRKIEAALGITTSTSAFDSALNGSSSINLNSTAGGGKTKNGNKNNKTGKPPLAPGSAATSPAAAAAASPSSLGGGPSPKSNSLLANTRKNIAFSSFCGSSKKSPSPSASPPGSSKQQYLGRGRESNPMIPTDSVMLDVLTNDISFVNNNKRRGTTIITTTSEQDRGGFRGSGISVEKGGKPTIIKCRFSENNVGMLIREDGDPIVQDCIFEENLDVGLVMLSGAKGKISRATLSSNNFIQAIATGAGVRTKLIDSIIGPDAKEGFRVEFGAMPIIERCRFTGCTDSAIMVTLASSPTVEDCEFNDCAIGVQVVEAGGMFKGSRFNKMSHCGCYVDKQSALQQTVFEDNDIVECLICGIRVTQHADAQLIGNRVSKNGLGIEVSDGAHADIQECRVFENDAEGILVINEATAHICKSLFSKNKSAEVSVRFDSFPCIEENIFYEAEGKAIFVEMSGGTIRCNRICRNFGNGIVVKGAATIREDDVDNFHHQLLLEQQEHQGGGGQHEGQQHHQGGEEDPKSSSDNNKNKKEQKRTSSVTSPKVTTTTATTSSSPSSPTNDKKSSNTSNAKNTPAAKKSTKSTTATTADKSTSSNKQQDNKKQNTTTTSKKTTTTNAKKKEEGSSSTTTTTTTSNPEKKNKNEKNLLTVPGGAKNKSGNKSGNTSTVSSRKSSVAGDAGLATTSKSQAANNSDTQNKRKKSAITISENEVSFFENSTNAMMATQSKSSFYYEKGGGGGGDGASSTSTSTTKKVSSKQKKLRRQFSSSSFQKCESEIGGRDSDSDDDDLDSIGLNISASRLEIISNSISDNKGCGITVQEGAAPLIESNIVISNGQGGISVETESNPEILHNLLKFNRFKGIHCSDVSNPVIKGNVISATSPGPCILVDTAAAPHVINNMILSGADSGLKYSRNGRGMAENNLLSNHTGAGITVETKSSPILNKNMIFDCDIGVLYRESGGGFLTDQYITGLFNVAGVYLEDSSCNPSLENVMIHDLHRVPAVVDFGSANVEKLYVVGCAIGLEIRGGGSFYSDIHVADCVVGAQVYGGSPHVENGVFAHNQRIALSVEAPPPLSAQDQEEILCSKEDAGGGSTTSGSGPNSRVGTADTNISNRNNINNKNNKTSTSSPIVTSLENTTNNLTPTSKSLNATTTSITTTNDNNNNNNIATLTPSKEEKEAKEAELKAKQNDYGGKWTKTKFYHSKIGVHIDGGNMVFENNDVHWTDDGIFVTAGRPYISGCNVYDAHKSGIWLKDGDGMVKQNYVFDNGFASLLIDGGGFIVEENKLCFEKDGGACVWRGGLVGTGFAAGAAQLQGLASLSKIVVRNNSERNKFPSPQFEKPLVDRRMSYQSHKIDVERHAPIFRRSLKNFETICMQAICAAMEKYGWWKVLAPIRIFGAPAQSRSEIFSKPGKDSECEILDDILFGHSNNKHGENDDGYDKNNNNKSPKEDNNSSSNGNSRAATTSSQGKRKRVIGFEDEEEKSGEDNNNEKDESETDNNNNTHHDKNRRLSALGSPFFPAKRNSLSINSSNEENYNNNNTDDNIETNKKNNDEEEEKNHEEEENKAFLADPDAQFILVPEKEPVLHLPPILLAKAEQTIQKTDLGSFTGGGGGGDHGNKSSKGGDNSPLSKSRGPASSFAASLYSQSPNALNNAVSDSLSKVDENLDWFLHDLIQRIEDLVYDASTTSIALQAAASSQNLNLLIGGGGGDAFSGSGEHNANEEGGEYASPVARSLNMGRSQQQQQQQQQRPSSKERGGGSFHSIGDMSSNNNEPNSPLATSLSLRRNAPLISWGADFHHGASSASPTREAQIAKPKTLQTAPKLALSKKEKSTSSSEREKKTPIAQTTTTTSTSESSPLSISLASPNGQLSIQSPLSPGMPVKKENTLEAGFSIGDDKTTASASASPHEKSTTPKHHGQTPKKPHGKKPSGKSGRPKK